MAKGKLLKDYLSASTGRVPISRVTGQIPSQYFKFPITAFIRHWQLLLARQIPSVYFFIETQRIESRIFLKVEAKKVHFFVLHEIVEGHYVVSAGPQVIPED